MHCYSLKESLVNFGHMKVGAKQTGTNKNGRAKSL